MHILVALTIFSGVSFIVYGALCLGNSSMKTEFVRFKVENFRVLVGTLEVLGGLGLLVGLKVSAVLLLSSFGLSVLMLIALVLRMKLKDGVLVSLSAWFFTIANLYIFKEAL